MDHFSHLIVEKIVSIFVKNENKLKGGKNGPFLKEVCNILVQKRKKWKFYFDNLARFEHKEIIL